MCLCSSSIEKIRLSELVVRRSSRSGATECWWEIICTYDGDPDQWAFAVGGTEEEARHNFFGSLAELEKAVITSITPLGVRS